MSRLAALVPLLLVGCGAQATVSPATTPPPTPTDEPAPAARVAADAPAKGATQIDCGDFHTCARMADGTARCWGRNDHAQLGDGSTTDRPAPVTVAGLRGIAEVAAGTSFTCARLDDGALRCWGTGRMLGDGASRVNLPPTAIPQITGATGVRAAGLVTCARTSSGARCWGLESDVRRKALATDIAELGKPAELATGAAHACARAEGGTVRCWGDFAWAVGAEAALRSPAIEGAQQLVTGDDFMCAIAKGGSVRCWGRNDDGQLGAPPDEEVHTKPLEIRGVQGAVHLSAGEGQACAVLGDGTVRCWGANEEGELGLGTRSTTEAPQLAVKGVSSVREVCIGSSHGCARTADGAVHCWGANTGGQVGDGTRERRLTPTRVTGL